MATRAKLANFSGSGSAAVINQGSISVSNGGFAILAAPYVQNTGFIKADLGTIALAGTNKFTLDLRGDGLINFVVPPGRWRRSQRRQGLGSTTPAPCRRARARS